MQLASNFILHISEGNYDINRNGLNEQNGHLNNDTLAGDLLEISDKMKIAKERGSKHLWVSDGLAEFCTLARKHHYVLESS